MFNAASSETTEEQKAVEDALREAMASSPSRLGGMDRGIEAVGATCLPDFTKCPEGWTREGVLCMAGADYAGDCAAEADLSEMGLEQKLAFADFCAVKFPCQGPCEGGQDFLGQICPSLWREIGTGICQAPLEYEGSCSVRLDVAGMSGEEKYTWSVRCGARWPCAAPKLHNYHDTCPKGWSLKAGQVCRAPQSYNGPCEHTAYMSGASEADKKAFEASCRVEWVEVGGFCLHDYAAPCPFGWHSEGDVCIGPLMYDECSRQKSFSEMTPAAKEDWASMCKVKWPCTDRSSCEKTYAAPCPADWYAFNGGMSCTAPSHYVGRCAPVLHGLVDLTKAEKGALEGKCGFSWPCAGEVYAAILEESLAQVEPRRSTDPAQYSASNGPIGSSSGTIGTKN